MSDWRKPTDEEWETISEEEALERLRRAVVEQAHAYSDKLEADRRHEAARTALIEAQSRAGESDLCVNRMQRLVSDAMLRGSITG